MMKVLALAMLFCASQAKIKPISKSYMDIPLLPRKS